jgi:YVTN family beta-propeller protein
MTNLRFSLAHRRALVAAACALACYFISKPASRVRAQTATSNYKNFEAPQTHPLALTPDGTRLLAVNTPNHTLSVFYVTGGRLTLTAEIPVGLEPVSVAARDEREAWVVNWLSDSVSVVDLKTSSVTRTFDVGDEPCDVVFAGAQREMAFVSVSGLNQVKVFDPNAPDAPPQVISIRGKQPRALTKDATGAQVFVSVFESGNNTTVVPFRQVIAGGGAPPPSPAMSAALPPAPNTALIVKWNGANWTDERGDGRWTQFIPYTLADVDVVALDASGANVSVKREIRGVGTTIGNAIYDPTTNQLYVANLEAHNEIRFEPNLRGRFMDNRLSIISLNGSAPRVSFVDLNSHVNYTNAAGTDDERAKSLALPADIARSVTGTIYIAATGSARIGVLDANGMVQNRISVGQGPTGLALDEVRKKLYVLNRFDDTISTVDLTTQTQINVAPVGFNPEPDTIKRGRRFLYDASLSAHGTVSCASCHLNAHRDGLAWDLGDPNGQMQQAPNGLDGALGGLLKLLIPNLTTVSTFHPMKGPMTTQSLRGLNDTEPLHWRGDRAGLANFNPAFITLLGGARQLNDAELNDFQAFVAALTYPPNPNQNLDRTLPNPSTGANATRGAQIFNNNLSDQRIFTCAQCHTAPPGGVGTNRVIIPAAALQESQDIKVPHLRGLYQKLGMKAAAGEQLSGFGFTHDGAFDNLFDFLHAAVFTFQNDNQRSDLEQFLLAFDTGTAPAVGLTLTVNANNKSSPATLDRLNLLMSQVEQHNCDLVARGIYNNSTRGFLYAGSGMFLTDRAADAPITWQTLTQSITNGAEITFTGVPVGMGRSIGIERTSGTLNGDLPAPPNAIDDPNFFVTMQYSDFLNREPDQAGLSFWTNQITSCNGDSQCIDLKRQNVSAAYFLSREFQETGFFVIRIQRVAFGKASNDAQKRISFQQFLAASQTVGRGFVDGQTGADQILEQNKTAYAQTIVSSQTFISKYPTSLSASAYVDALFQTAGVQPQGAERQDAINAFGAGDTAGRAAALRKVAESNSVRQAEFNAAFVLLQYFGYLRRNPTDLPDTSDAGYQFWLGKLNAFGGDYIRSEMVRSFILSSEYRRRFGQR